MCVCVCLFHVYLHTHKFIIARNVTVIEQKELNVNVYTQPLLMSRMQHKVCF